MAPAKKIDLKDKVEDGEIDLSMLSLEEVPVREIASVKKAYNLDLSNNLLTRLPNNFSTLTNLTKIDLSKNKIKELPENFGNLEKLIHLDLYKNELQHLPLSFHRLKNLKWLDLKDNPLVPAIARIAGPCLDNKQCQSCAKDIVQFYIQMNEKIKQEREAREMQRQRDLAHKAKLEKKKKEKKEKNKQKDGNDNLSKKVTENEEVPEVQSGNLGLQEHLHVKQKRSFIITILWIVFAFSFSSFLILFLATSMKVRGLQSIEQHVISVWLTIRDSLPPYLEDYVVAFEESFKYFHSLVGQTISEFNERLIQLSGNPQIKVVQEYFFSACNALSKKVNETYYKFL